MSDPTGLSCAQGALLNIRYFFLYGIILMCSACTTSGQLYYIDTKGNEKLGCDVEFVGIPSVDKYAVEYALLKVLLKMAID